MVNNGSLIRLLVVIAVLLSGCGAQAGSGASASRPSEVPNEIRVAAASDLRLAFEELGRQFADETGTQVVFSFGSSGLLREQVINGAPFDIFASANVEFVDDVIEAGQGDRATKSDYALGRIVMWAPAGKALPSSLDELAKPAFSHIAIANPQHAPYGLAAKEALQSEGVYGEVADRLVYGENISDTLRIVQSGNAEVGIVALSLVIAEENEFVLIDQDLHEPLQQALVVTATGDRKTSAQDFADFISSPAGRKVMVRYGFVLPGESLAHG